MKETGADVLKFFPLFPIIFSHARIDTLSSCLSYQFNSQFVTRNILKFIEITLHCVPFMILIYMTYYKVFWNVSETQKHCISMVDEKDITIQIK